MKQENAARLGARTLRVYGAALRRLRVAFACLFLVASGPSVAALTAQTIRGTVVDESSKLPIASVLVSVLDDQGKEISTAVRSDSLGNFVVHAGRAGKWRVRATRIGYNPIISDDVDLAPGGLAVVRLRMTTVAQQLIPVVVVERRQLNANELMSTAGFDLRESRGLGKFLSGERLADMKKDGLQEILATHFQPTLFILDDPVLGDVLRIREGAKTCVPEVFLDGRLLATGPKPRAIVDGPPPTTPLDSLRAQMRAESDSSRVGLDQMAALTRLSSLTAEMLHGVELYRSYEVPPASLGGWFGMTKSAVKACGTVAVWTKAGAISVVAARKAAASGRVVQVVMGTLLDYDTGAPLAGYPVSLLSRGSDPIGTPVMTDARGDFTLRFGRAGDFRLTAGGGAYLQSTTEPFPVSANELVLVKLFVSARSGVLAPLGVAARVLPQQVGPSSLAGFTYRRERAQGGTFFRAVDIERSGARSIADIVRSVSGVAILDTPNPGTVVLTDVAGGRESGSRANCLPVYYLDGRAVARDAPESISSLPVDRIFGVEVYARPADIPPAFIDVGGCGLIVIWTKR